MAASHRNSWKYTEVSKEEDKMVAGARKVFEGKPQMVDAIGAMIDSHIPRLMKAAHESGRLHERHTKELEMTEQNFQQVSHRGEQFDLSPTRSSGESSATRRSALLSYICEIEEMCSCEKVGGGRSGDVFKITAQVHEDVKKTESKALKTMSARRKQTAQRAIEEAKKLQKIVHPHIVRLFDFHYNILGEAPWDMLQVMEYIGGGSLRQETERRKQGKARVGDVSFFSLWEVGSVAKQLICALAHCMDTEARLNHGDVKPSNVLIHRQSVEAPILVKLTDFSDVNLGTFTPLYMSPQRLMHHHGKNNKGLWNREKADVFSLGLSILSMELPISGLNENRHTLDYRLASVPPSLSGAHNRLQWVPEALSSMLQWHEEDRSNLTELRILVTDRFCPRCKVLMRCQVQCWFCGKSM